MYTTYDLWQDPAGVPVLLARWTEKLAVLSFRSISRASKTYSNTII